MLVKRVAVRTRVARVSGRQVLFLMLIMILLDRAACPTVDDVVVVPPMVGDVGSDGQDEAVHVDRVGGQQVDESYHLHFGGVLPQLVLLLLVI